LRQLRGGKKAAGEARRQPVHHAEDALHVLSFQLLREQNLARTGILRANVEAQLCGSDLQQGAGNVGVGAGIARHSLRPSRIQRLAILARTLHRSHHALGGEHIQSLYLGQIRGKHIGETIVEPV
jgi:hypothetical protein